VEEVPKIAFHIALFTVVLSKVTQLCHSRARAEHRQLNFDKVPDTGREKVSLIKRIATNLTLMPSLNSLIQFFVFHASISFNPESHIISGSSKWQNVQPSGPSALQFIHPLSLFVIQKVLFSLSYLSNCDQLF